MGNSEATGTGIYWTARLFALFWMALIFYLSSKSSLPTPALFPGQDKLVHGLVYGVLGISYWVSIYGTHRRPGLPGIILITLLALVYGLTDEFHQTLVPGRNAEVLDVLADTVGGFLGALLTSLHTSRLFSYPPAR